MPRRVATAVLFAVLNLLGPLSVDADVFGDDALLDDTGVECVELHRDRSEGARRDLLDVASGVCGAAVDDAWVARGRDGAVCAASVEQTSPHVACVTLAASKDAADPRTLAAALLPGVLYHCRSSDVLKLVLETTGISPETLRPIVESAGYQFSRVRDRGGAVSIEFYADLYWRPGIRGT